MEKAANADPKILSNYVQIGTTSIGMISGVLCADNGLTIPAAPVQNSNGDVNRIRKHIQNLTPFECDNWDSLCLAVVEEYDAEAWRSNLIWIIGCIRHGKLVEKMQGSWNFPLRFISDSEVKQQDAYKVFRKHWHLNSENFIVPELRYEFHETPVVSHQWLKAEISGSPGLTGLEKHGGRFHLLWNKEQAEAYLSTRAGATAWFTPQEAVMVPVEGRSFDTLDLVYVPPKLFVWGIDSKEMYVKL